VEVRYAAVGLTLVACGRFGFDPIAASVDDAGHDARVDGESDGRTRMAPIFVQVVDNSVTDVSAAVTFDSPVVAGDLLVVAFGTSSVLLASMTDTTGDTFTMLPVFMTPAISPMYVGYAIAGTSAAETITADATGSDFITLRAHEYASVDPTAPLDTYVMNAGSSSGVDAIEVDVATQTANELVFAYAVSQSMTASAGTDFNARSIISMDVTEDQAEAAAGTHLVTATNSGSPWGIQALAFLGK
jgi:hypothetical protein